MSHWAEVSAWLLMGLIAGWLCGVASVLAWERHEGIDTIEDAFERFRNGRDKKVVPPEELYRNTGRHVRQIEWGDTDTEMRWPGDDQTTPSERHQR